MTAADETRRGVLVDVVQLQQLLRDQPANLVILHVGAAGDEGIAGAIPVTLADFAGPGGGSRGERPLPEIPVLQEAARRWGIDPDSTVVLYDDKGGLQAARGWWVLRWAGLAGARLLDGGLAAWRASGGSLARLEEQAKRGVVDLSPDHLPHLDADGAAKLAAGGRLLDARGAAAFAGDQVTGSGGHIPGAINAPAAANLTAEGHFAEPELLRLRFAAFGAVSDVPVGVSCGSGVSAAHTVAALASIGIPAALYAGSWSAWSADGSRPVAYGSARAH